jgi:hypothetical protein
MHRYSAEMIKPGRRGFSVAPFTERELGIRISNCSQNSSSPFVQAIKHIDGVNL